MKKVILFLFILFNINTFAQWRSYYPEGKLLNHRTIKKQNSDEKSDFIYNNHFFLALKAKSLENYTESLDQFQKCIDIRSKDALPFYESSLINRILGNLDLAEEQIKIATKLNKANRWFQLTYAEILYANQDFYNAAIQYQQLMIREPGNIDLYYSLADMYIYDNNFKKAITVYDNLEKKKGVEKAISVQKHKLYMQLKNRKSAINELVKLIEIIPNDIEILQILSELYLLDDQKDQAFKIFKKLAVIDPNNGRIHLTLADYYRDNGDNDMSFEELKLAFQSTKLAVDLKVQILVSYFQVISANNIMLEQAYLLSKLLIRMHPNEVNPRAVYADILYTDNKFQEAKKQYFIVLERDKTRIQIWNQILFIQAEQNDFAGMLKTSEEALSYFSTDPLFYYFNGISNKWFKNNKQAISALQTGVEFIIDNKLLLIEFYSSLADLYHLEDEDSISDSLYEKVLALDSLNVLVLNNYAYYLSIRKEKLEKARRMSFLCNQIENNNGTYQDTYAWILYQLSDYKGAKYWLDQSLLNGGNRSAVIVDHYGDVLYKLGDIQQAIIEWEKARELGLSSDLLDKKIKEGRLYD